MFLKINDNLIVNIDNVFKINKKENYKEDVIYEISYNGDLACVNIKGTMETTPTVMEFIRDRLVRLEDL